MNDNDRQRLEENVNECTISFNTYIEKHKSIIRRVEDSFRENNKDADVIFALLKKIIESNSSFEEQRFFALFLVKDIARKINSKPVYDQIKSKILDTLQKLAMKTKGLPKMKECGKILTDYATGHKFEVGLRFYQLTMECLATWAKDSNMSEFELVNRQVSSSCPKPISPPMYYKSNIEDVEKLDAQLLSAIKANDAANNKSQAPGSIPADFVQINAPKTNFSMPQFKEFEQSKQDLIASLNKPNVTQDEIQEKIIMLISMSEDKERYLEEAANKNLPEKEIDAMFGLIDFVGKIKTIDVMNPSISEVRRVVQNALSANSFNPNQSRGMNSSFPKPTNDIPASINSPKATQNLPNQLQNLQPKFTSPVRDAPYDYNVPMPGFNPTNQKNLENIANFGGVQNPNLGNLGNLGMMGHDMDHWDAASQDRNPMGKKGMDGGMGGGMGGMDFGGALMNEHMWDSGVNQIQDHRFQVEEKDDEIKINPTQGQFQGKKISPAEIELKNRELKSRKAELERQISSLKQKEKALLNENKHSDTAEFFRHDSDPKLLIEEISRKNREYESLRSRYNSLLEQMNSKVRADLMYTRRDLSNYSSGFHESLIGIDVPKRFRSDYQFKNSSMTNSNFKTSYFY